MSTSAAVALLLEDEPLIDMDLEQTLEAAGFDVTWVMSCKEANDWLGTCRPDLVIVDVQLRDGPSDKVVGRLVEAEVPFIVHSGDDPEKHVGTRSPIRIGTASRTNSSAWPRSFPKLRKPRILRC